MPSSIIKEQNEDLEDIGLLSSTNADLKTFQNYLDTGKLNLGLFANVGNAIRNRIGGTAATEESQKYQDLTTNLEKMKNASLRLNKGVQTEGDAQRAWKELFDNVTDNVFVSHKLHEIINMNERAAKIKKLNINSTREEYGKDAMDFSNYENQKSSIPDEEIRSATPKSNNKSVDFATQYSNMPSGTVYTAPDGTTRRKP